ncbi:MAG: ATP-binding cassette domain-containing protein [Verrucomicrobiaceae bacterium]|nr:ATP-binding cassette domain-containing protein [Verrucomicrobiaceae bacterium]
MIQVENLRKEFGSKVAVNGVSFSVEKGQVLGFLGPNGAGKSTTMRMVTGYFRPTSGKITVGGVDMLENPEVAKRSIGYLPENAPLYSDMTVSSFLDFCAELRGLRGVEKSKAVDRAIEMCFLQGVRYQSVDTLSKGYKHRTCLAQSIIHDPEVLILDEPTDGLDPNQKHEVRGMIKRMGENKVIIFSTHILEEVEAACSRAIIIDRGKVVADGTPDELKQRAGGAVRVSVHGVASGEVKEALSAVSGVERVEVTAGGDQSFAGRAFAAKGRRPADISREIAKLITAKQWMLEDLHPEEGKLDEVFRAITRTEG